MPTQQQRSNQQRTERLRGWIIKILYVERPNPVELAVISETLDGYNIGVARRSLAAEIEFLRTLKLIRVFSLGGNEEIGSIEQAKLLQRYANSDNDQEMHTVLCATLTARGINFQEGLGPTRDGEEIFGVQRLQ